MEESIISEPMDACHVIQYIRKEFAIKESDLKMYSPLTLAFIGDGVYDLIARSIIVEMGNAPVNKLHRKVSGLVKASAQVEVFHIIEPILLEEELAIYRRGRNAKSFTSAKNASVIDYRIATGFEALVGYLYLDDQFERIVELVKMAYEKMEVL